MKENMKKKWKVIFWCLIIIGIIARVYRFPVAIPEMHADEIMAAVNAKSIVETGADIEGTTYPIYLKGWGGQSVMLLYLMALCMKIFGFTLFSVRLPMLIISIISLFVFYDFIKKLSKNHMVALIGLGIVCISPWHIQQSIWSMDCNMFPHFLLFAMDICLNAIIKKKKSLLYFSMVMYGISLYCYGLAIYIVPLFLLILAIYLIKTKTISIKELLLCAFIFAIVATPIVTMFTINLFKLDTIHIGPITIPNYESLNRTQDMLLFSKTPVKQLIENAKSMLHVVIFQEDRAEWNGSPEFGTMYLISNLFVLVAIVNSIKHRKEQKGNVGAFMVHIWFILSLLIGIFINHANINRLNALWYPMMILVAEGIYAIYKMIPYKKTYQYGMILLYASFWIAYSIYFHTSFYEKVNQSSCYSKGFYQSAVYASQEEVEHIYYDNTSHDGNLPLYISFTKKEGKQYHEITNQEELEAAFAEKEQDKIIIVQKKNAAKLEVEQEYGEFYVIVDRDFKQ